MATNNRQPAGVPTGGQFTSSTKPESLVSLTPESAYDRGSEVIRRRAALHAEQEAHLERQWTLINEQKTVIANGEAALLLRDALPEAATYLFRRDQFGNARAVAVLDGDGVPLTDEKELARFHRPGTASFLNQSVVAEANRCLNRIRKDRSTYGELENLDVVEAVQGAVELEESAFDVRTSPLTESQRETLAQAAEYARLGHDDEGNDEHVEKLRELLGY